MSINRVTPKSVLHLFQLITAEKCKKEKIKWPREATMLIGHYLTLDTATRKLSKEEEVFLFNHIPKEVIEIMFKHGGVIAGGFVSRILDVESIITAFAFDVDIWFLDKDYYRINLVVEEILKFIDKPTCRANILDTVVKLFPQFRDERPIPFELRATFFQSVRDLLYQFDFDYVQNAIHGEFDQEDNKMTLYLTQTPLAIEARATKTVRYIADRNWDADYLMERIAKISDKDVSIHDSFCTLGDMGVRYMTANHYLRHYTQHINYDDYVKRANSRIANPACLGYRFSAVSRGECYQLN